MSLSKERIIYLLNVYSGNKASDAEMQELMTWVNETNNHHLLYQHIQKLVEQYDSHDSQSGVDWDQMYKQILNNCAVEKQPSVVRHIPWLRWFAAAAIILLFGTAAYIYINPFSSKKIVAAKSFQ